MLAITITIIILTLSRSALQSPSIHPSLPTTATMLPKAVLLALAAMPSVFAAAIHPLERDVDPESGITWTGRIFKTDTEVTTLQGEASVC
jgi:hypothetical protein